jgi:hypothetical protein
MTLSSRYVTYEKHHIVAFRKEKHGETECRQTAKNGNDLKAEGTGWGGGIGATTQRV